MAAAASSHGHAGHAHNADLNRDPTRSKTLRREYAQRLRGWFGELNAAIRKGVVQRDVFRLSTNVSPPPNNTGVDGFMQWLRRQERRGLLRIIERDDNVYVQRAYGKGVRHADIALRRQGVEVPERDLRRMFNQPVHRDTLQRLYTRNYEELSGISNAVNQQVSREITAGFAAGENPTKIARRITDRVDAIGKTRATTLARTSVIEAHSEATLNRYEQMGVGEVTIQAEYSTAGDRRVCPLCQSLEGTTYTIQQAREETFTFEASEGQPSTLSGEYPVNPPIHPRCRCAWIPRVS